MFAYQNLKTLLYILSGHISGVPPKNAPPSHILVEVEGGIFRWHMYLIFRSGVRIWSGIRSDVRFWSEIRSDVRF